MAMPEKQNKFPKGCVNKDQLTNAWYKMIPVSMEICAREQHDFDLVMTFFSIRCVLSFLEGHY